MSYVTLAEAKKQCNITHDDDDSFLSSQLIPAAEEAVAHRDRLRAEVAVADARVRSANLLCERYRVLAAINRLRQNG